MDFFRTPGGSLDGKDREAYGEEEATVSGNFINDYIDLLLHALVLSCLDEAQEWIHKATSEFLVRTDWNCNIQCTDKISTIKNTKVYVNLLHHSRTYPDSDSM